ncbi:tRNA (adenine(22)-N(1))-methyltransferase [Ornithinibacillus bavariensis]|uniref:SAM-dependent methyltransferase n=1 Tax=Ornithinibacillus bavariensis TaxID=545502 RepID=A0A920C658_9BACI|nr:tRNA (adenine(22)-N(1))-methyltransferase TrmK [Ornithinibacillus bavariensis]GIO27566.1 SAM-dependent methyltransferase [Ornithinibacillus bavariensis]HAM81358.1 tRNA (adenine(22)-N(1))-methyltransferase TrmK [Ornithinibacillus sp.]
MTEDVKLSERLITVASFLPIGANFADIGSDHAYLPCYVCMNDETARAIAGDVRVGPLSSARETVSKYNLTHVVDVRLGDGLQVLKENEVEQVVIAGMGGSLIRTILEQGQDKLGRVELIIAQPNVDEKNVRKWYMENDYQIQDEVILEENGHIYEIIVGKKSTNLKPLTDREIFFGPILLKERLPLFYKKWQIEKDKLSRVLKQMGQAKTKDHTKMAKFKIQLEWIEEVLEDAKNNHQ